MLQPRGILCPPSPPVPTGGPRAAPPRPRRVQPEFGPVPAWGGSRGRRDGRTHGRTDGRREGRTAAPGRCLRVRPAAPGNPTPARGGRTQRLRCPLLRRRYKTSRNLPKPPEPPETSRGPQPARSEGVSAASLPAAPAPPLMCLCPFPASPLLGRVAAASSPGPAAPRRGPAQAPGPS